MLRKKIVALDSEQVNEMKSKSTIHFKWEDGTFSDEVVYISNFKEYGITENHYFLFEITYSLKSDKNSVIVPITPFNQEQKPKRKNVVLHSLKEMDLNYGDEFNHVDLYHKIKEIVGNKWTQNSIYCSLRGYDFLSYNGNKMFRIIAKI